MLICVAVPIDLCCIINSACVWLSWQLMCACPSLGKCVCVNPHPDTLLALACIISVLLYEREKKICQCLSHYKMLLNILLDLSCAVFKCSQIKYFIVCCFKMCPIDQKRCLCVKLFGNGCRCIEKLMELLKCLWPLVYG